MNEGLPNPGDLLGKFNPFGVAGDIAGKAVADGWTGIMMALWKSGLWVLRFALDVMDQWMTPDISAGGPAAELYRTTFWAAGALVLIMAFVQLGVAASAATARAWPASSSAPSSSPASGPVPSPTAWPSSPPAPA